MPKLESDFKTYNIIIKSKKQSGTVDHEVTYPLDVTVSALAKYKPVVESIKREHVNLLKKLDQGSALTDIEVKRNVMGRRKI